MKCFECLLIVSTISLSVAGVPASRENAKEFCDITIEETEKLSRSTRSADTTFMPELKTITNAAQVFSPVLAAGAVGYVAFTGLSMFIPSTLDKMNVPRLNINQDQRQRSQDVGSGLESIGGEFIKGLISRTEAGEAAKETGRNILVYSADILQQLTKFLQTRVASIQTTIQRFLNVFNPTCLSKYICYVGQFTGVNFPSIGELFKGTGNRTLDEFSQAFIEGTTTRDCMQPCDLS